MQDTDTAVATLRDALRVLVDTRAAVLDGGYDERLHTALGFRGTRDPEAYALAVGVPHGDLLAWLGVPPGVPLHNDYGLLCNLLLAAADLAAEMGLSADHVVNIVSDALGMGDLFGREP